jgi:hypothetical protein
MSITAANLSRWAGLSAVLAGSSFVVVGLLHPPETLSSVTTGTWLVVHLLTIAVSFFGLLGITGLYVRQAEEVGWLGLVGFLLFSLWLVLIPGFTFFEALILPLLAIDAPTFAADFLGTFTGVAVETNLGILPTLWLLLGVLYILGPVLFGVATLRAGILSRWAAGMFGVGAVSSVGFALLPPTLEPLATVPMGLGFAWLGYSLWSERRATGTQRANNTVPGLPSMSGATSTVGSAP